MGEGPVLIGIDAGTTVIKTVAYAPDGTPVADARRENAVIGPEGWSEQDMTETWERTAATVREVVEALDGGGDRIVGVGVTGQGDGCWLVDADGDPVRNAVLWNDGRAAGYVESWQESGVADRIFDVCGNGVFPGASLPVLCWLRDEEPDALARADTVFHCKDWIKYRLTGARTLDLTDASLPFLDIRTRTYTDELSDLVDLPGLEDLFPRLTEATDVVGRVTDEAARATGLPAGTPVVSGVIDIVASAVGSGVATVGDSSSVVGTTSLNQSLVGSVPPPEEMERVGFTLAIDDRRYTRAMASMAGTPNLDWAREHVAEDPAFEAVEAAARSVPPGADGVLYHPYLSSSGERSPFLKPSARAGFTGLAPDHTRAHLLRAVYEGVALAMRDCFEHLPAESDEIAVSGGGARSAFWCEMFADCLDTAVTVPVGDELGAKGVALLAGVALDVYPDLETAVDRATATEREYTPDPDVVRTYDAWYDVYRETYEALFDAWDRRAEVLEGIRGRR